MIVSFLILVCSTAMFFFYIQAFCERALRREFSQPYFQNVIAAIRLEYPLFRDASASNAAVDYEGARLALKCDFTTLSYLLKNGDGASRRLSRAEKALFLYFRMELCSMSIRHAFKLQEGAAITRMSAILQHFANLVGENLSVNTMGDAVQGLES